MFTPSHTSGAPGSIVFTEEDYFGFLIGATTNEKPRPTGLAERALVDGTAPLCASMSTSGLPRRLRDTVNQEGGEADRRGSDISARIDREEGACRTLGAPTYLKEYVEYVASEEMNSYTGSGENSL